MNAAVPQLSIALQGDKPLGDYAELGALVEEFGFDAISVYADLMFQPALPALLSIAGATSRIRLGPACLNPFTLHPVEIAGQIAMLDAASNGRAYLGLARGAWLDSLGIEPAKPLTAMREAVAVVSHLLAGKRATFAGEVFRLEEHHRLEYPVLRERVPLMIGTWGPRLGALAGELADEVKVGGSANPLVAGAMRASASRGVARAGRAPGEVGIVLGAVTVVDEDREAARALARREVARYLPVVGPLDTTIAFEPGFLDRIENAVTKGDFAAAAALISDDVLDRFAFAGTPGDIALQVEAIFAAGAARVEFGTPHGLTARSGLHLLGTQVLPRFRG